MNTMNMPGFTAGASLYGASAGDRYTMHSTTTGSMTDEVLPQMKFDRCLSVWRHMYIGCRLDGGNIGWCSYYADAYWDALGCDD